jgi:hypothetical protein
MSPSNENDKVVVMHANLRVAIRERLLSIVRAPLLRARDATRADSPSGPAPTERWTLLVDSGNAPVQIADVIETIRRRHPDVRIAVLNGSGDSAPLPCEFGNGPPSEKEDPVRSPLTFAALMSWGSRLPGAAQVEEGANFEPDFA